MRNLKRRLVAASIGVGALLIKAASAFAAAGAAGGVGVVNTTTNTAGLPGIGRGEAIADGLITFCVIAFVAGLIMRAMVWTWSRTNSDLGEGR